MQEVFSRGTDLSPQNLSPHFCYLKGRTQELQDHSLLHFKDDTWKFTIQHCVREREEGWESKIRVLVLARPLGWGC